MDDPLFVSPVQRIGDVTRDLERAPESERPRPGTVRGEALAT